MPELLVEIRNVWLESGHGNEVFRNLSFTLLSGRSAVITGPAGSGKTSFVDVLIGQRPVKSGSVEVAGESIRPGKSRALNRVRRKIGGVGGVFTLIPSLTVAENIVFPLLLAGDRRKVCQERLLKALTEFSLIRQSQQYPDSLTRVENTLVQFARASIAYQPLLVIDEPLAGLDPATYERILDHLVAVALSGRSMIILGSQPPPRTLPEADYYQITDGALA
ncbi:MAG TPA: ATP-binding cassette domain-containing protein [Candidatus Deferrimicrobium sp.]|nr:ATP-binding cassette domain-containing protein [Candidatus Deferrimicrobium sp.]